MSEINSPETKTCNTCNAKLPLSSYPKNKNCKNGLLPQCKECKKAVDAAYYLANKERVKHQCAAYYLANRDKAMNVNAKWRKANWDKVLQASTKYRTSDRGIAAAKASQARRDPVERKAARAETAKKYRLANLDLFGSHRRNRRAREKGACGSHTKAEINKIIANQGGKCVYCQRDLDSSRHVDHITPLVLGGSNDAGNLQVLCKTCNLKKGSKHPLVFALQAGLVIDMISINSAEQ